MRAWLLLLLLPLCAVARAQDSGSKRAGGPPAAARVPARKFIDTKRWTCLVDARGSVHCTMRTYEDFWPSPTIPTTSSSFERVSGLSEVTALEGTGDYVCALDKSGEVHCWGCLHSLCRLWPKRIGLSRTARQIVVDNVGACALLESGGVQCWGSGASGQLGRGRAEALVTEQPVAASLARKALQISATTDARCALLEGGRLMCWGAVCGADDPSGLKPRYMSELEQVSAIAANESFTCAVAGAQREVYCWGHPDAGQTSAQAAASSQAGRCEITKVRKLHHVKQLALGYLSGAALTDDGALYYWGNSHYGGARQLADKVAPQTRVEFDRDFRPVTSPAQHARAAKRFDQEPDRVASNLPIRNFMLSGNYVCLELDNSEVRCEWTLAKTPFHIEEVWPDVRFDTGTGKSPRAAHRKTKAGTPQ